MAQQDDHVTGSDEREEHTEAPPSSWKTTWQNNTGVFLILISELFGSAMDAIVRYIQQGEGSMHPFQIIVARMGITLFLSSLYMWWKKVPDFPLGKPEVRGLLILRAVFGFSGLYCYYYAMHYLPLAESTVFRFLVPIVTAWSCSIFLSQPFLRKDIIAGLVALIGVIFIAHPAIIFGKVDDAIKVLKAGEVDEVTPAIRALAIGASMLGIVGASGAYTMIRVIGSRAHALMSVNYFAFLATLSSTIILLITPDIGFTMPRGVREWVLLMLLGVFGFALQFLLTAGLQMDKSSKATAMLYTQIVFALIFDWAIWGMLPGGWSLFGGSIVIASTLWSALQKPQQQVDKKKPVDEESALLGGEGSAGLEPERRASVSA